MKTRVSSLDKEAGIAVGWGKQNRKGKNEKQFIKGGNALWSSFPSPLSVGFVLSLSTAGS